jgi:hypothetical protein
MDEGFIARKMKHLARTYRRHAINNLQCTHFHRQIVNRAAPRPGSRRHLARDHDFLVVSSVFDIRPGCIPRLLCSERSHDHACRIRSDPFAFERIFWKQLVPEDPADRGSAANQRRSRETRVMDSVATRTVATHGPCNRTSWGASDGFQRFERQRSGRENARVLNYYANL